MGGLMDGIIFRHVEVGRFFAMLAAWLYGWQCLVVGPQLWL